MFLFSILMFVDSGECSADFFTTLLQSMNLGGHVIVYEHKCRSRRGVWSCKD